MYTSLNYQQGLHSIIIILSYIIDQITIVPLTSKEGVHNNLSTIPAQELILDANTATKLERKEMKPPYRRSTLRKECVLFTLVSICDVTQMREFY